MAQNRKKLASKQKTPKAKANKIIDGVNISNLLTGPLKLLCEAVEEDKEIILSLRNNHKMYCKIKAFDKHCNILIYNVKEVWTVKSWESKTHVTKERYISQAFLRGDNIIMIVKCPGKKKGNQEVKKLDIQKEALAEEVPGHNTESTETDSS